MISLREPSAEAVREFLVRQGEKPFSYPEVGASRGVPPPGYAVDHRRACLGEGPRVFDAACAALRQWQMFELGWVRPCRPAVPIVSGETVAILAHWARLWFLNACRIVYVLAEEQPVRRFGFAYGTLPEHAESGEERFTVEQLADGTVWYDLFAFSRPGNWAVRLGYPLARRLQKRFGIGSLAAMRRATEPLRHGAASGRGLAT